MYIVCIYMYVHVHVCTRHFVHCTYNENNYTKTRITVEPPIKDPPRKGTTSLSLLIEDILNNRDKMAATMLVQLSTERVHYIKLLW